MTKGMTLRHEIFGLQPHSTLSARGLLSTVSSLKFIQRVAPGGLRHLRHGWNAVRDSGIMGLRCPGDGRAETQAAVAEEVRNGMHGGRKRWNPAQRIAFTSRIAEVLRDTHVHAACGTERYRWVRRRRAPFTRTQPAPVVGHSLSGIRAPKALGEGLLCGKASIGESCGF